MILARCMRRLFNGRLAAVAILMILVWPASSIAIAATYNFPESPGPFNLNPGDTLVISSGVFSGQISGVPSGAVLHVVSGAEINLSTSVNVAGLVEIESGASARFASLTLGTGFKFRSVGSLSFLSNPNMNGSGHFEIEAGGSLDLPGNFILSNGSSLVNRGTVRFEGNLNTSAGTELVNAGEITGSSSSGTFNPNGLFVNTGLVDVQGFININTNSEVVNHCSFIARDGYNNNSPSMENHGIILTTGSQSAIQINQPLRNGPGGYLQSDGVAGSANFTNNASAPGFHGGGSVYVAGQSRNQGVFGGADGAVNFYDASISGSGLFDQTNMMPHASVTGRPTSPITLAQARSRCRYAPLVSPPQALDDRSISDVLPGTDVVIEPLDNDQPGSLDIVPSSLRLLDENGVPTFVLIVPGEGTWTVVQDTGSVAFTPEGGSVLTPTPVSYSVADSDGNRSDPATIGIVYAEAGVAEISAQKSLTLLSEVPVPDCEVFDPDEGVTRGFMPGACIEYLIEVSNGGQGEAVALSVRDVIDQPLIFWGARMSGFGSTATLGTPKSGVDCTAAPCQIEVLEATLAPGAAAAIRIRMTVK